MTRITQESLGLFIGKSGSYNTFNTGSFLQVKGAQLFNYSIGELNNKFLYLGGQKTLYYNTSPSINFDFSYNLINGDIENAIGLSNDSGIYNIYDREQNFHFIIGRQYYDLNFEQSLSGFYVVSFCNSSLSNYNINGNSNGFVTCSMSFSALNFNIQEYTSGIRNAAVNKLNGVENSGFIQFPLFNTGIGTGSAALLTNNVEISVGTGLLIGSSLDQNNSILTNFSISFDFGRNSIEKLGYKYPAKRCLSLPSLLNINLEANFISYIQDSVQNLACSDDRLHNLTFKFFNECKTKEIIRLQFSGLRLTSQQSSVGIGQRKTISFAFEKDMYPDDSFYFTRFIY